MYWLRRGYGGLDKRVEGSCGPALKTMALNINAEDNFALAA